MRRMKFVSPTSFSLYNKNIEEFYLMYLSDNRPEKIPQSLPMAIGSAFDVLVKDALSEALSLTPFSVEEALKKQVEVPENYDPAVKAAEDILFWYKRTGAFADLVLEMKDFQGLPRMEMSVTGLVSGVPMLGKPDLFFTNKKGRHIVLDWKVNGYCGKSNTSPKKGYVKIRDGWENMKHSPNHGGSHKDAQIMLVDGVWMNIAHKIEEIDASWSVQLPFYAYLLGEQIPTDCILGIEQIVGKNVGAERPLLRFATFRSRASTQYQLSLVESLRRMWEVVNSDWIFRDLPKEESKARCDVLDKQASVFTDEWFNSVTRGF